MTERSGRRAPRAPASFKQADGPDHAHLRRALGVMFPAAYLRRFHQPPLAVCSLFALTGARARDWTADGDGDADGHRHGDHDRDHDDHEHASCSRGCEPSSEPSSRAQVIQLRECLRASLAEHQAKPVGLCPVRRAIYDQCFDELIRQTTVGCVERGLLLFRVRNELRMTLNAYRRAYDSAVRYGLGKALEASLRLAQGAENEPCKRETGAEMEEEEARACVNHQVERERRELANARARSEAHLREYYEGELAKRDEIIGQQRAVIRALQQGP